MAMQRFRFGNLPIPPSEYSPEHLRQAFRILELYFNQLDSTTPLSIEGLQLLNLPTSGIGLRVGTVFRVGQDLKIVVLDTTYLLGTSASGVLGTVSIILGPPARPLGVSTSGSLGMVSVTIVP